MNTTLSRIDAALEALETWRSEPLLLRMDQLQTDYKQIEAERMEFLSAQRATIGSTFDINSQDGFEHPTHAKLKARLDTISAQYDALIGKLRQKWPQIERGSSVWMNLHGAYHDTAENYTTLWSESRRALRSIERATDIAAAKAAFAKLKSTTVDTLKVGDIVMSNVYGQTGNWKVAAITHGGKRVMAASMEGGETVKLKNPERSGDWLKKVSTATYKRFSELEAFLAGP